TFVPVECEGSCHAGACDNRPNHCPVETFINCGSECGEMSPYCLDYGNCDVQPGVALLEFEEPGQSHVVRIGDYAALCTVNCNARETRGFRLFTRIGTTTTMRWRITVPAPLRLVESGYCVEQSTEGCVVVGPDSGDVLLGTIVTDDPAAPEANILIESAAGNETLECP